MLLKVELLSVEQVIFTYRTIGTKCENQALLAKYEFMM